MFWVRRRCKQFAVFGGDRPALAATKRAPDRANHGAPVLYRSTADPLSTEDHFYEGPHHKFPGRGQRDVNTATSSPLKTKRRSQPPPTRQQNWAGPASLTSTSSPLRAGERSRPPPTCQQHWAGPIFLTSTSPPPASGGAQPATAHSSTKLGWASLPDKYKPATCELGSATSQRPFVNTIGWASFPDEHKSSPASYEAQPATAHSSTKLGWANLLAEYKPLPLCELGSAASHHPLANNINNTGLCQSP